MTTITHICMSDLHLGAANGVLTNLDESGELIDEPSRMLRALAGGIAAIVRRSEGEELPQLVVAGDLFELALTSIDHAVKTFGHFSDLAWPDDDPLFSDAFVFVPGNHDHHLWEHARMNQYISYLTGTADLDDIVQDWHVTHLLPRNDRFPADENFITALVGNRLGHQRVRARTVYPNFGIVGTNDERLVVISHGHFIESIYRLMSAFHLIFTPGRGELHSANHLEADNFAWIDFFWSTMGRSGDAGADIDAIYEMLTDVKAVDAVLDRIIEVALERRGRPTLLERIETFYAKRLGHRLVRMLTGHARRRPGAVLTDDADRGLTTYLAEAVRSQIDRELDEMPANVDFVFGHTHKPLVERRDVAGYEAPVLIRNTGGWVVDSAHPESIKGGTIVLVDDDLNTASLNLYRQHRHADQYAVAVERIPGEAPNPLERWLDAMLVDDPAPWQEISDAAAAIVARRTEDLASRVAVDVSRVSRRPPDAIAPRVG